MSNHFREKVSIRIQSMKIKTPFTWAIFNANFIAICTANFAASKTRLENSGDFSAVGILPWSGISRRFRTYQECTFQGNSSWTCRWLPRSQWKSRQKYFTPPKKIARGQSLQTKSFIQVSPQSPTSLLHRLLNFSLYVFRCTCVRRRFLEACREHLIGQMLHKTNDDCSLQQLNQRFCWPQLMANITNIIINFSKRMVPILRNTANSKVLQCKDKLRAIFFLTLQLQQDCKGKQSHKQHPSSIWQRQNSFASCQLITWKFTSVKPLVQSKTIAGLRWSWIRSGICSCSCSFWFCILAERQCLTSLAELRDKRFKK